VSSRAAQWQWASHRVTSVPFAFLFFVVRAFYFVGFVAFFNIFLQFFNFLAETRAYI
jgi:hypothetical protein